jgi:hypothetical protein
MMSITSAHRIGGTLLTVFIVTGCDGSAMPGHWADRPARHSVVVRRDAGAIDASSMRVSDASDTTDADATDGRVAERAPWPSREAGFIEIPPGLVGLAAPARMFYSFTPAALRPEHAPLLVFFNGGPGVATTAVLLPYGTGPYTLDPDGPLDQSPRRNPAAISEFANLLYLDSRQAGFSYDLAQAMCLSSSRFDTSIADAAEFLYAVLQIIDTHSAIRSNPVVLVGESFGGARAALMLYLLQHAFVPAATRIDDLSNVGDSVPWLRERLAEHFRISDLTDLSPVEVAAQFGFQILIEPGLNMSIQREVGDPLMQEDPDFAEFLKHPDLGYAADDVRSTDEYLRHTRDVAQAAMRTPANFPELLGVAAEDMPGLAAIERAGGFRAVTRQELDRARAAEQQLAERLGDLGPTDVYWTEYAWDCQPGRDVPGFLQAFFEILPRTATFITHARYDSVIYGGAWPGVLGTAGYAVTVDQTVPTGARPGVLRLHSGDRDIEVRFPRYEAGHTVTVTAAVEFREDVEAWLVERGALEPPQ